MASVDEREAIPAAGRVEAVLVLPVQPSLDVGRFFDNSVDCIRQPIRDEISRESSR
jgi:hypothetical protein